MLYAAIVQCPVFKGTLKSVDETAVAGMKGVRKIVRLHGCGRGRRRQLVAGEKAVDALPVTWDDGGNGSVSSAAIAEFAARRPRRGRRAGRPQATATSPRRSPARPQRIEAEYERAVPGARDHGAAELHRARHARRVEIWAPTQDGEAALATAAARRRRAARARSWCTARCSAAASAGAARCRTTFAQAVLIAKEVGAAGQAGLDARRGHPPRLLPSDGDGRIQRRPRRGRHAGRLARAACRAVDPSPSMVPRHAERLSTGTSSRACSRTWPTTCRTICVDYAMRADARAGRLLARGQLHAERLLQGELHRRDGACGRPGSLSLSPQAAAHSTPQASRRARRGGEQGRLGRPPPPGVFRGIALNEACGSYLRAGGRGVGRRDGEVRVHRVVVGDRLRPCGQPAVDRDADPERDRLRAHRGALRRDHHQGRRASSSRTSTTTRCCASPTCRRWRPCWCRAAASGAASASRRCRRWRRLCATRSSPRPASASARCR